MTWPWHISSHTVPLSQLSGCSAITNQITCSTSTGVKGEDRLNGYIHRGSVEGLEHDLSHLLTICFGIQRGFSQKNGMLFWSYTELVVKGVVPDSFHVVPVGHDTCQYQNSPITSEPRPSLPICLQGFARNGCAEPDGVGTLRATLTVLDRILERQDTTLRLCLVTNIGILLAHAHHHSLMTWPANNAGKDGTRRIVSGESSLQRTECKVMCPEHLHCTGDLIIISELEPC